MAPIRATNDRSFGYLLRRYRLAALLTQEQLAERAHLSYRTISDLERGAKHTPRRDTVLLLADALELPPQDRASLIAAVQSRDDGPGSARITSEQLALEASLRAFLIAELQGYASFTETQGGEAATRLTDRFATVVRECVEEYEGRLENAQGDEVLVTFSSVRQALRFAVHLQEACAQGAKGDPALPLRIGIGLDVGEVISVEGGYRGGAVKVAARLCSLAGPGEVLASETVANLAQKVEGLAYFERGLLEVEGFNDAVRAVQIVPSGPLVFPPASEDSPGAETIDGLDTVADQQLPIGGFLGALPSGALIARGGEMAGILTTVDAVHGGEGRLVMLAGEPGVGKTRLAQEVTVALRNQRFVVAAGRCYETCETTAYYPFVEALTALYSVAPARLRDEATHRWPYLSRLLPDLITNLPVTSIEAADEQGRLFHEVTGFLTSTAKYRPVALLIDDLHWADTASLELIQYLARHTRDHHVLLLGTYRDVEVNAQHPLRRALHDLNREQLLELVTVRHLELEGTAALVAAAFGEADVSEEFSTLIHSRTEGNPFFTREVIRTLVERGDVYRENGHWQRLSLAEIELPETIRFTIGQRLSRLRDETRAILHEASVLGQTFNFEDVQALDGRSESEVETALEEATAAVLIRELSIDAYEFSHALIQQTLYAELSRRRRPRLHLSAGEALERLPVAVRAKRASELARHFLQGRDLERALRYELLAGEQSASVYAHTEAAGHFRAAIDLAREVGGQRELGQALLKTGQSLQSMDQLDAALPVLEEAARLHRSLGDPVLEGRALVSMGAMYAHLGQAEKQAEVVEQVETVLTRVEESHASLDLANLYHDLANLYFFLSRYGDKVAMNEREATVARALENEQYLIRAELGRAQGLSTLGRYPEARSAALALIPPAEGAGDLPTLQAAMGVLAETAMQAGQFEESHEYRKRESELTERTGATLFQIYALGSLAQLELYRGRWDEAGRHAERALELARATGNVGALSVPLLFLGQLTLWKGDWEEAVGHLEECIAVAERMSDIQLLRHGQHFLAELDLLVGRPEEAIARLKPILDRPGLVETDVVFLLPTLAWAYLDTGDAALSTQTIAECLTRAEAQQSQLAMPDALRIRGMILARQGLREQAERSFNEAILLARRMPLPYLEARAAVELGTMYMAVGEGERARERLADALAIFNRLGAQKDVERTEQAIIQLG